MNGKIVVFVLAVALIIPAFVSIAEAGRSVQSCTYTHPPRGCSNQHPIVSCYSYYITCDSYANCQDGSTNTLNSCINPGTASSYCSSSTCPAGFADANNNPSDGCEVNLNTDRNNCGSVGNVCPGSSTCNSGVCGDFSVAVSPTGGLANAGDSKTVNATLSIISGAGAATTFSASGLPTGSSASFSPTSCTPSCYSNMTIATSGSTPPGSYPISVTGALGTTSHSSTYTLTILSNSCNNNGVCEYPETQASCASDCKTTATMSSPVSPGDIATVSVEFFDSRYTANEKVKIDLNIDGTSPWTSTNGCFFGGVRMGPSVGGDGTIAWPSGTISTDGHFKITTSCQVPSTITAGAHTLVATPTII